MDEREVECKTCDAITIMTREDIQSGWIFQDPGWCRIDRSTFCPKCKERMLRNSIIVSLKKREYPTLDEVKEIIVWLRSTRTNTKK